MNVTHDWADAINVLAVRLDCLGDVLMTGPALRALKHARAGRHVTLLTSPAGAGAGALLPEVDEVLVHEVPWMKTTPVRANSQCDLDFVGRLQQRRFDAAAIFTVYSQSPLPAALFCYLAGIPRRLAHCRENPYQLLTHWAPEREPESLARHEVRRQLDLVAEVGCTTADERLLLPVAAEATLWARERLKSLDVPVGAGPSDKGSDERWALIHPGASAASRRYPAEGFAAAARALAAEHGCRVVFTGAAGERALVDEVREVMQAASVAIVGGMDLAKLAAVIAFAPVLITNNTGPAHIAAAVGTPVVDLYALTNPQHTPWAVSSRVLYHDVPCKFCYRSICPELHHDCLRKVAPQAVVEAVLQIAPWAKAERLSVLPGSTSASARQPPAEADSPVLP
jgi:ADP-heptose:LPS heptosyltransferase